jgi:DNA helicase II / ATP-dependent DNA helicase PcrA
VDREAIFAGLNPEQRRAVETVRGPVCILAGAGSGKTTTVTRRIANQVACGAFAPEAILALTFTDRAAGELRGRLAALGVHGVQARTFHSAAYAQLRGLSREPPGRVLPSKTVPLRHLANRLPKPYRFRPAADLATEIEWAKNRRVPPHAYRSSLGSHRPPIPADLMARVYGEYERRKQAKGLVDFEDLLELAVRMYETDSHACGRFRRRYLAFTVDEYQDVNLLQQTLLDHWLGERDELCAVGDDYQAIYGFTGATSEYLLSLPTRFPSAAVIRLEASYRSTTQVLALANRLVPGLGGSQKGLRATRGDGPEPILRRLRDRASETAFVVERIRALHEREGVAWNEIAVLYRVNARSEEYEASLAAAGVPYQVRSGRFLERAAARRLLAVLRGSASRDVAAEVRHAAESEGLLAAPPPGLGEFETTRQLDLARLVELAAAFAADGERTVADFVADLERRFAPDAEQDADGVHLLTYHRAKGLEFDAVFLPRLEEHELPIRQARTPDDVAEERRLLYVGITRAKRHLVVTSTGKPSPFLVELGAEAAAATHETDGSPLFQTLRKWRRRRAEADGVPAYVVFRDRTLAEIASARPGTADELAGVPGVGPTKLERYGGEVLATVRAAHEPASFSHEP